MDSSLFESALEIAENLDLLFNKTRSITMTQRDVPGLTRSALPLLNKHGVRAITVGVNGATAPPAVPRIFTWKDLNSGASVLGMWKAIMKVHQTQLK